MKPERLRAHGWRLLNVMHELPGIPAAEAHTAFVKGPCRVLVGRENHDGTMRYHLSISCKDRYPGWEEIKDARYSLLPAGLTFAMILPPLNEYVNVHPNCFHLWEIEHGEW